MTAGYYYGDHRSRSFTVERQCPHCGEQFTYDIQMWASSAMQNSPQSASVTPNINNLSNIITSGEHRDTYRVLCGHCGQFTPSSLETHFPDGLRNGLLRMVDERYTGDLRRRFIVFLIACGAATVINGFTGNLMLMFYSLNHFLAVLFVPLCFGPPLALHAYFENRAIQESISAINDATDNELRRARLLAYFHSGENLTLLRLTYRNPARFLEFNFSLIHSVIHGAETAFNQKRPTFQYRDETWSRYPGEINDTDSRPKEYTLPVSVRSRPDTFPVGVHQWTSTMQEDLPKGFLMGRVSRRIAECIQAVRNGDDVRVFGKDFVALHLGVQRKDGTSIQDMLARRKAARRAKESAARLVDYVQRVRQDTDDFRAFTAIARLAGQIPQPPTNRVTRLGHEVLKNARSELTRIADNAAGAAPRGMAEALQQVNLACRNAGIAETS